MDACSVGIRHGAVRVLVGVDLIMSRPLVEQLAREYVRSLGRHGPGVKYVSSMLLSRSRYSVTFSEGGLLQTRVVSSGVRLPPRRMKDLAIIVRTRGGRHAQYIRN